MKHQLRGWLEYPVASLLCVLALTACGQTSPAALGHSGTPAGSSVMAAAGSSAGSEAQEQLLRGRHLVISHGCGDCHGGYSDPGADAWLAGRQAEEDAFIMGPYRVWSANLTPDPNTGLGRYTDRQIFNALRFGLRPGETPDGEITSTTPGVGNHPAQPNYLAPVMLWTSYRHMTDAQLRDIIAYLRHVRPVSNDLPSGVRPADFWASEYSPDRIGSFPLASFPTPREELSDPARRTQILQGRAIVVTMGCGDCHGGGGDPASDRWLQGVLPANGETNRGPFEEPFEIGPFMTYPRNLTPDNTTGVGRFSERQIFNALRFGLRPGETPDIEITSSVPGEGNHPASPKYLAPPMPWPAWRHMSDEELRAVAAYLKLGLKPVRNRVPDSHGPPDFWMEEYTSGRYGSYPAPPFPTASERRP
jgi:mono/diheme cytochrome c family protein